MIEIQATEAKAHLAELLNRVQQGESIAITRHGQLIAHLVPAQIEESKRLAAKIDAFRAKRRKWARAGMTTQDLLDLRHDGHRI